MTDIKDVAEPWTDPLGNVWCATPGLPGSPRYIRTWVLQPSGWQDWGTHNACAIHPDLLRGLGRTHPPVPTPTKVAGAVRVNGYDGEYAVQTCMLYFRINQNSKWETAAGCTTREFIAAAHKAFQQVGDVLPA